jgi:hypothetical protein
MSFPYLHCYIVAPLSAATPAALTDSYTTQQAVLPVGAVVSEVYLHAAASLVSASTPTLSIGAAAALDQVLPAAAGITAAGVTAGDLTYRPSGVIPAVVANTSLVLTASDGVTSGEVKVLIFYRIPSELL